MGDKIMLINQRYSLLAKSVEIRRTRWLSVRDHKRRFVQSILQFRFVLESVEKRVESEVGEVTLISACIQISPPEMLRYSST